MTPTPRAVDYVLAAVVIAAIVAVILAARYLLVT